MASQSAVVNRLLLSTVPDLNSVVVARTDKLLALLTVEKVSDCAMMALDQLPHAQIFLLWFWFLRFGILLGVGEHLVLQFLDKLLSVLLILKGLFHLFLGLIVDGLYLVYLIHVENVVITNFLQELKEEWPLSLGLSLCHPLVQVDVDIVLLHHLADDVGGTDRLNLSILGLSQLSILDSLLSETEFKHFDASNQIIVDVLLGFEL